MSCVNTKRVWVQCRHDARLKWPLCRVVPAIQHEVPRRTDGGRSRSGHRYGAHRSVSACLGAPSPAASQHSEHLDMLQTPSNRSRNSKTPARGRSAWVHGRGLGCTGCRPARYGPPWRWPRPGTPTTRACALARASPNWNRLRLPRPSPGPSPEPLSGPTTMGRGAEGCRGTRRWATRGRVPTSCGRPQPDVA